MKFWSNIFKKQFDNLVVVNDFFSLVSYWRWYCALYNINNITHTTQKEEFWVSDIAESDKNFCYDPFLPAWDWIFLFKHNINHLHTMHDWIQWHQNNNIYVLLLLSSCYVDTIFILSSNEMWILRWDSAYIQWIQ